MGTTTKTFAKDVLEVETRVWDRPPLTLHEHVATAAMPEGGTMAVKISAVNSNVYVVVEGGRTYEFSVDQLCYAVLRAEELRKKPYTELPDLLPPQK